MLLFLQICLCFITRETTCCTFLDLDFSITNGIVSFKLYDKRDGYNFEIVNFPFLDRDVPHSPSYGVYISQLIRVLMVVTQFMTAKLLKQGYQYHKIRKAFSKFTTGDKYNIGLKPLLQQGISESVFLSDLV